MMSFLWPYSLFPPFTLYISRFVPRFYPGENLSLCPKFRTHAPQPASHGNKGPNGRPAGKNSIGTLTTKPALKTIQSLIPRALFSNRVTSLLTGSDYKKETKARQL
jgi:hypothetical protein